MNDAEAARNLQTIRTLMERAALYRRALGPILINLGAFGILGMAIGTGVRLATPISFLALWLAVAVLTVLCAAFMIRRQAFRDGEPFWNPPTRRIAAAMSPPFFLAGVATGVMVLLEVNAATMARWLPATWLACYGLALHAAGFFTLRGVRQLGWAFILSGAAVAISAVVLRGHEATLENAHFVMGGTFGLGHALAGAWLSVRERKSAS